MRGMRIRGGGRTTGGFKTLIWGMALVAIWTGSSGRLQGFALQEVSGFSAAPYPDSQLVMGTDGAFYGTFSAGGSNGYGLFFRVTTNGTFTTLASFNFTNGLYPKGGLVLAADGAFYGTTAGDSGAHNYGTVFRATANGGLTTLVTFNITNGLNPAADLVQGQDGALYGTTSGYGSSGNSDARVNADGTVFRVTTNGALTTLVSFAYTNGAKPNAGLALDSSGLFYGTTSAGGEAGRGTVFQITPAGTLTTLASFTNARPAAGLVLGADGAFYGTTAFGGSHHVGSVFRVTTSGAISTLVSFNSTNGINPHGNLVPNSDGSLYGTTVWGGSETNVNRNGQAGYGTVFKVTTNGELAMLRSFSGTNGAEPIAGLAWGADGKLYGTTSSGGPASYGTVFRVTTNGAFTLLNSFGLAAAATPGLGFVQGEDSAFYGTSVGGGSYGLGTVFRVGLDGSQTVLASFDNANGEFPNGLAPGNDGAFYGTTYFGGAADQGTVFRITTNGVLTTLVSFNGANGATPQAGLVLGRDGMFYGTTGNGGASDFGTVFRVTTNGLLTTLTSLGDRPDDGRSPCSILVQGVDGAFYGATSLGGDYDNGTLFRVTTGGVLTTVFDHFADLTYNIGTMVQGGDGALYGTTGFGGPDNRGTVFRMTTNGVLTTLVSFDGTNGAQPWMGLVLGEDSALYGTTSSGGEHDCGTVFRATTNGTLTTLASFDWLNGRAPYPLVQGSDGALYGTTASGGSHGGGNVFRVSLAGEMQPLMRAGNGWNVSFVGLPEDAYRLLRATNLSGPWSTLATVIVDTNGMGLFTDDDSPSGEAFYRVASP